LKFSARFNRDRKFQIFTHIKSVDRLSVKSNLQQPYLETSERIWDDYQAGQNFWEPE